MRRAQGWIVVVVIITACDPSVKGGQGTSSSSTIWPSTAGSPYYSTTGSSTTGSGYTTAGVALPPFATIVPSATWPGGLVWLTGGDFNGDGQGDVAFSTSDQAVHVLFGPITPGAHTPDEAGVHITGFWDNLNPRVVDWDHDARDDLFVGTQLFALPDSGTLDADLDADVTLLDLDSNDFSVADIDADGELDLLVMGTGEAGIFYGPLGPGDVATSSFTDIWRILPPGPNSARFTYECAQGNWPLGFSLGDLNADGLPEVVLGEVFDTGYPYYGYNTDRPCSTVSPTYLLEPGDSRGLDVEALSVAISHNFQGVAPVADVDGDGAMDFVMWHAPYLVGSSADGLLSGGSWAATGRVDATPALIDVDPITSFGSLGDLDDDGRPDLGVAQGDGGWFLSSASLTFPAGAIDASLLGTPLPALAGGDIGEVDVDGDGIWDLGHVAGGWPDTVVGDLFSGADYRATVAN